MWTCGQRSIDYAKDVMFTGNGPAGHAGHVYNERREEPATRAIQIYPQITSAKAAFKGNKGQAQYEISQSQMIATP
jgi:hypothetical protein